MPPHSTIAEAASDGRATPEFLVTKEHRRFIEFADACRREHFIGVCCGAPGVGKTLSARRYTNWDTIEPALHDTYWTTPAADDDHPGPAELASSRSVLWTPIVTVTARQLDQQVPWLCQRFSAIIDHHTDPAGSQPLRYSRDMWAVELVIVDEADRLKTTGLEQLRDFYDRNPIGLILIGIPGLEKRLARYPQLYSRIGFSHQYRTLSTDELHFVLSHHWEKLGLQLSAEDFTDTEAVAAVARITGGNFRLVHRLFAQIQRILEINDLQTVTREVVEAARETLVIGNH